MSFTYFAVTRSVIPTYTFSWIYCRFPILRVAECLSAQQAPFKSRVAQLSFRILFLGAVLPVSVLSFQQVTRNPADIHYTNELLYSPGGFALI